MNKNAQDQGPFAMNKNAQAIGSDNRRDQGPFAMNKNAQAIGSDNRRDQGPFAMNNKMLRPSALRDNRRDLWTLRYE